MESGPRAWLLQASRGARGGTSGGSLLAEEDDGPVVVDTTADVHTGGGEYVPPEPEHAAQRRAGLGFSGPAPASTGLDAKYGISWMYGDNQAIAAETAEAYLLGKAIGEGVLATGYSEFDAVKAVSDKLSRVAGAALI
ncbi:hypothetical protein EON62_06510, partial [archaeon]